MIPQLTYFTVSVAVLEFTLPAALDTTQRYFRPLNVDDMVKLNVAVLEPVDEQFVQVVPSLLHCHWYFNSKPEAATVSFTSAPFAAVTDLGWVAIFGLVISVTVAALEFTLPAALDTTQRYLRPLNADVMGKLNVAVL